MSMGEIIKIWKKRYSTSQSDFWCGKTLYIHCIYCI